MIRSEHILTTSIVALLGGFIFLLWSGYQHEANMTPDEVEARKERSYCISKVRGSRPACWDERDWEAYCKYVECKQVLPEDN